MIIDFHYHYADRDNYVEDLLSSMDKAGVDKTVLLSGNSDFYWAHLNCIFRENNATLEAIKKYPDRIVGGIYLDPRMPDCIETFERYADAGFKLVKMFPPMGYYPDDEAYFPLYEKIQEYGMPVLIHVGLTSAGYTGQRATSSKYSHPLHCDLLLRMFPKINFIFAHMGYPYYEEVWAMASINSNLYLDISGVGCQWMRAAPYVYEAIGMADYAPIDFKKVVWGTDNILSQTENLKQAAVIIRRMGCKPEEEELVFGETARKLLRL